MKGPNKIKKDYGIRDIYDFYLKQYDNTVDYKTFNQFLFGSDNARTITDKGIINNLKDEIINKAYALVLGKRMGILQIKKKKRKVYFWEDGSLNFHKSGLTVDWKATKRYWEHNPEAKEKKTRIWFKNDHTQGYKMRLYWDKLYANFDNKTVYRFQPVRKFNRDLAKAIQTNHKIDYYEF